MKNTIFVYLLCLFVNIYGLQLINENVVLNLDFLSDGSITFSLNLNDVEKISGKIGEGTTNLGTLDTTSCDGSSRCVLQGKDANLTIDSVDSGFSISWQTNLLSAVFQDCLDLQIDEVNWFGGPEKRQADWPVENANISNRPYTTIKSDNGAVSERYWLNSKGGYVFIYDRVPLFLDQNNLKVGSICFIGQLADPYVRREEVVLEYSLIAKDDPKEAQLHAVNNYLGKPQGHPDDWIIRNPIWTTWAKYKKNISDDVVLAFGNDIASHGFTGQIEIDEFWETCFGSLIFNDVQFANINTTVQSLKDLGFTVSLWISPFVNDNCQEIVTYAEEQGYFVASYDSINLTSWWEGDAAHYIDFTNEDARNWFSDRVKLLQELHGFDSFKFDAGESDYPPPNPVLHGDVELSPNAITSDYVRTCATFGKSIEVRSAWRTQDLPNFVRMLDKDSRWGLDNGLHTLITSLLQFNIIGYTLVLPDMIGGNAYGEEPSAELIARWIEANTFMPTMQFSFLPWEFPSEEFDGAAIIKKFVALHEEYADEILNAMDKSISDGIPVNPPIWWVDPTDRDAFKVNDEYLLGETVLVAPVIQEGATSRDVYLPTGSWKDGNDGTVYEGPQLLEAYPAPIDVLPYFIKQ